MKLTKNGFTIIELIIASGVFSVILLLVSSGIIKIGQTYTKGIIAARTQETSRTIIDEITRSLQFNGGKVSPAMAPSVGTLGPVYGFCIDSHRYSYLLDRELVDGPLDPTKPQANHVFVIDTKPGGCLAGPQQLDGSAILDPSSRELMGLHMQLDSDPYPAPPPAAASPCLKLCVVKVRVVYGDKDVLVGIPPNLGCQVNINGGHFCSVSELSTTIEKRVQ